jgi:hypothetical protein
MLLLRLPVGAVDQQVHLVTVLELLGQAVAVVDRTHQQRLEVLGILVKVLQAVAVVTQQTLMAVEAVDIVLLVVTAQQHHL